MADDKCPVCGANPCYRICPTQDPYQGDQAAENTDYEFNARYDDVRERYASTAADADLDHEAEVAWDNDHPDDGPPVTVEDFAPRPGGNDDDVPF
jgi:hypothetical protein